MKIEVHKFALNKILVGLLLLLVCSGGVRGQAAVARLESVGFTVSEMDGAVDFYTRVLPFKKNSDTEVWGADVETLSGVFGARVRVVRLQLGDETLELTEYLTPQGRPIPVTSRSHDRWFQHVAIVVSDLDQVYKNLRRHKVRYASTAPQTLPAYLKQAAGIKAFYFKDVDQHILELIQYPPGKGAPKWHELAKDKNKLFLGIDHTAIVVEDTNRSLEFYRGLLQMKISGESENYGPEQEHLNNVRGARLRITSLQTPQAGMGVELLQYLAPNDGQSFPQDTQANDLWHWQTSFVSAGLNNLVTALERQKVNFISGGIVSIETKSLAFEKGLLVRDPDGHAVRIIE
ncbi:MAG: VOC family protein [Acidobacteria bacterium]|nr:VOC family protein [Acidobacteriota bacterium]